MIKALIIGGATVDVLVEMGASAAFAMGTKNDVRDIVFGVGGGPQMLR